MYSWLADRPIAHNMQASESLDAYLEDVGRRRRAAA
jgi:hypothetical protein